MAENNILSENNLNKSKVKNKSLAPRTANFTQAEKSLLTDLVDIYKKTVENKHTDAATSRVRIVKIITGMPSGLPGFHPIFPS